MFLSESTTERFLSQVTGFNRLSAETSMRVLRMVCATVHQYKMCRLKIRTIHVYILYLKWAFISLSVQTETGFISERQRLRVKREMRLKFIFK